MDTYMLLTGTKEENNIQLCFSYLEAKQMFVALDDADDIRVVGHARKNLLEFIDLCHKMGGGDSHE